MPSVTGTTRVPECRNTHHCWRHDMTASITEHHDPRRDRPGQRRRRRRRGRHLPRQPADLHRRGDLRTGDQAHLRGQLDLSGPREPGAQPRRLLHHLHRPAARRDHPGQGRRAALSHQCLRPPRRDDLPAQDRQPDDADLPVPRVDVPQRRHPAQGQGSRRRRLPRDVQRRRLATT